MPDQTFARCRRQHCRFERLSFVQPLQSCNPSRSFFFFLICIIGILAYLPYFFRSDADNFLFSYSSLCSASSALRQFLSNRQSGLLPPLLPPTPFCRFFCGCRRAAALPALPRLLPSFLPFCILHCLVITSFLSFPIFYHYLACLLFNLLHSILPSTGHHSICIARCWSGSAIGLSGVNITGPSLLSALHLLLFQAPALALPLLLSASYLFPIFRLFRCIPRPCRLIRPTLMLTVPLLATLARRPHFVFALSLPDIAFARAGHFAIAAIAVLPYAVCRHQIIIRPFAPFAHLAVSCQSPLSLSSSGPGLLRRFAAGIVRLQTVRSSSSYIWVAAFFSSGPSATSGHLCIHSRLAIICFTLWPHYHSDFSLWPGHCRRQPRRRPLPARHAISSFFRCAAQRRAPAAVSFTFVASCLAITPSGFAVSGFILHSTTRSASFIVLPPLAGFIIFVACQSSATPSTGWPDCFSWPLSVIFS